MMLKREYLSGIGQNRLPILEKGQLFPPDFQCFGFGVICSHDYPPSSLMCSFASWMCLARPNFCVGSTTMASCCWRYSNFSRQIWSAESGISAGLLVKVVTRDVCLTICSHTCFT